MLIQYELRMNLKIVSRAEAHVWLVSRIEVLVAEAQCVYCVWDKNWLKLNKRYKEKKLVIFAVLLLSANNTYYYIREYIVYKTQTKLIRKPNQLIPFYAWSVLCIIYILSLLLYIDHEIFNKSYLNLRGLKNKKKLIEFKIL